MSNDPSSAEKPVKTLDDLVAVFHENERPEERWRIGTEAEKFGVTASGAPLGYDDEHGVLELLHRFETRFGWQAQRETKDGPIIALRRGEASITLEPAAQLELSGAPLETIHETAKEMDEHLVELAEISRDLGHAWVGLGFQPFARHEELPWVPKLRYGVMKTYLPSQGKRGLDMMRRTATVQANFDYASETDALRKLRVMLKLSVVQGALFANSPFFEGRRSTRLSERADVWLNMDPRRSGRIRALWEAENPGYRDYVEWALDAGMFLFKRGDRVHLNTGQTFRSFMQDGFEGERPTSTDWWTHLGSLFPEVRLKNTLEVRSCDCVPRDLLPAIPALSTGLIYDETALARLEDLVRPLRFDDVARAERDVPRLALDAELLGRPLRTWAEQTIEIAQGGLRRRARLDAEGNDESVYLAPLVDLVSAGRVPSHRALDAVAGSLGRTELAVGDPVDPLILARSCPM